VIELAKHLELTEAQHAEVQALFDAMQAETVPIGESLIKREVELERQFADRTVTPASLNALTQEIGGIQGALRAAHLRYHLATFAALTPEQVGRYNEKRGYGTSATGHHHRAH
jgi:Spy/CpxP family protein refolding chaperone